MEGKRQRSSRSHHAKDQRPKSEPGERKARKHTYSHTHPHPHPHTHAQGKANQPVRCVTKASKEERKKENKQNRIEQNRTHELLQQSSDCTIDCRVTCFAFLSLSLSPSSSLVDVLLFSLLSLLCPRFLIVIELSQGTSESVLYLNPSLQLPLGDRVTQLTFVLVYYTHREKRVSAKMRIGRKGRRGMPFTVLIIFVIGILEMTV